MSKIRWQEVIELDPRMNATDLAEVTQVLMSLESSEKGQKQFREALAVQRVTPLSSQTEHQHDMDEIEGRRKEFPKIFISTLDERDRGTNLYQEIVYHYGGGGELPNSVILFHIKTAEADTVPQKGADGMVTMGTTPFSAKLSHELQHVIDDQRERWLANPSFSAACKEMRGVEAENEIVKEKFPQNPLRNSYLAPEKKLEEFVQQHGLIPNNLVAQISNMVALNQGCTETPRTAESIQQEARNLIFRSGIDPDTLRYIPKENPPTAFPRTTRRIDPSLRQ